MSEIKRVIIPREVAEAIESFRNEGCRDDFIVRCAYGGRYSSDRAGVIKTFADQYPSDFLSAIVNGYEVEKTEEELADEEWARTEAMISERYRSKRRDFLLFLGNMPATSAAADGYADGIKFTLYTLGITIPGVNAPEGS